MSNIKFSQIASGGALNPATDVLLAVRTGNTDVVVTPGTAAAMAASLSSGTTLSSLHGTFAVGHIATFFDTNGTIQDGGALGTAATKAASNNSDSVLASITGATPINHFVKFADNNGSLQDGGASITESELSLSDVTTGNVTSAAHGFAPKSPANVNLFLNGGGTPAYIAVTDIALSLSDNTSNNVSISAHGFAPKLPNDATKFLDGTGSYSTPTSGAPTFIAGSGTATAGGSNSFAAGGGASSAGNNSVAIGVSATASATDGIAIGDSAVAGAASDICIGVSAVTNNGGNNTVIGANSGVGVSGKGNNVCIGNTCTSSGNQCVAIGLNATTGSGNNGIAIGNGASVSGLDEIMIGRNSGNNIHMDTSGNLIVPGQFQTGNGTFLKSNTPLSDGSAANTATLTNAPAVGNPTKWIPINDNGTTRYIPVW